MNGKSNGRTGAPFRKHLLLLAASASALGLASTAAHAEDGDKKSDSTMGEVMVTARFRSENVQNTPLAVTALSNKTLENRNITNVTDLGSAVPNAYITPPAGPTGSAAVISMRGIYQSDFIYAFEPGVGVYIDDVYHPTLTGAALDLMDLDRVEVLRGPQGTLFGKNSMGGAIRLFSKTPKGDDTGYVEAGIGTLGRYEFKGGFDTALIKDKLFLRVSGAVNHTNGYVNLIDFGCRMIADGTPGLIPAGIVANKKLGSDCKVGTEGGEDLKAGRLMLRWVGSPRFEVGLTADIIRDDRQANPDVLLGVVPANQLPPLFPSVPPWNGNPANGPATVYDSRFVPSSHYESYANITTGNTASVHQWGVSLTPQYEISDKVRAKLVLAYRQFHSDFSYNPDASPYGYGENSNPTEHHQYSAELQITGEALGDKLDWTLGGYYFDGSTHLGGHIIYSFLEFDQDDDFKDTSKSAFAHGVYHFNDALSLSAGVRYSFVDKTYFFHHPGITNAHYQTSASDQRPDWVVNLNYKFSPDVSAYVQAATGFRPGGVNPRPIIVPDQLAPFKGEDLISYEGGVKTRFLEGRATFNLAGFYSDYKSHLTPGTIFECLDTQQPSFTGPAGCPNPALTAPWFYYFNDKARIYGVEAELQAQPIDHLSVNASVGWNHGKSLVTDPTAPNYRDPSNLFQPEWNASVGVQYAFLFPSGASLTPRVDWAYQGKMTFNGNPATPATPLVTAPGYSVFNGRLSYTTPDDGWTLALSVTNMFNKFYYYNKFAQNGFAISGSPSLPREWLVSIRKTF